VQQIAEAIDS